MLPKRWTVGLVLLLALVCSGPTPGQEAPVERGDPLWLLPLPEVDADPEIPTLEAVVGHPWAGDISSHSQVEQYIQALAKAAPDRTRLVRYGESYEGRSLSYLVLSSAENLDRIEAIQKDVLRLANPGELSEEEAEQLIEQTPAVVWLAYSVHGDETSSSDAALITAYTLLADRREATREILDRLVVIIDPLQNPDGRDRFLHAHREARGPFPSAEPLASERTQRWARGRLNHYLFDMNRDWFLQTQQETRAKVAAYLDWHPQIYVDAHEMGSNSQYFFDPPSDPLNSRITSGQLDWFDRIGRHHAERFDEYGFAYTTREMFDAFYPGYGSTWPTMQGSIGILWEQAGVRGLVVDRDDETQLHYHDAVRHHYLSGLATLEAAAAGKDDLLSGFHQNRASAIAEAQGEEAEVSDYYLLPGDTPTRAARLARLLRDNGIEVRRVSVEQDIKAQGPDDDKARSYQIPEGSYHVPAGQAAGRLVRTLLDRGDDMGKAFIERQLDRRARRLSDEIYDVTAWSLPLSFGIRCLEAKTEEPAESEPLGEIDLGGRVEGPDQPKVGYLVPSEDEAVMLALAGWLREGLRVHVLDQPTMIQGRRFGPGALLLRNAENPGSLHESVREAAREYGLSILALDSSYVEEGAGLGGPNVSWVKPPRILMPVGDSPISTNAGHTWYLFDQVWKYPVTRVDPRYLDRGLKLDEFDVLILPDGGYSASSSLGGATADRLKDWVRQGGTLILVGGALSWGLGDDVGLIASEARKKEVPPIPDETDPPEPEESDKDDPDPDPNDDPEADESEESDPSTNGETPTEAPDRVPGAFLRASVYRDHWVNFGMPATLDILMTGNLILEPLKPTVGRNLVTFQDQEEPVSGFCWPQTLDLIGRSPYALYQSAGQGHVIGFTADPNFRAQSPVTSRLFLNAVFFGPGHR